MDFTPTADQELLRETARALLANECPPALLRAHLDDPAAAMPLWRRHLRDFAALGGGPTTDLCVFLEETGYVAAPGPFLATALAAPFLQEVGDARVDDVLSGARTATVAIAGATGTWVPNDEPRKTFVLEADRADVIAVVGSGPRVAVVDATLPVRLVATVDGSRRLFEVETGGATLAWHELVGGEAVQALVDRAHVAIAAETVGTARRIFDMTLHYAKHRRQFDVPIGSFQAIQHKLAEMALVLERATAAVHFAAMTCDAADAERTRACHVAKAAAGEAAHRILKDGIQIHGGIGYTWEHDLQLFLRRALGDGHLLGSTAWHQDRIADLLFA